MHQANKDWHTSGQAEDLARLPLSELRHQLEASPEGLGPGRSAAWHLRVQRAARREDQPAARVPVLLLGADPMDDRGCGHPVSAGARE